MNKKDFFDPCYVAEVATQGTNTESGSQIKKFLNCPLKPQEIAAYGTSKPKRVVIKAKISGG